LLLSFNAQAFDFWQDFQGTLIQVFILLTF